MDFIGLVRETTPGTDAPAATRYFPFLTSDEERCEECGVIRTRSEMEFVGTDEDGVALYRCR